MPDYIKKRYSEEIKDKARKIRAIIADVDGVLTDGGIIYTGSGEEIKNFHVRDGMIVRPLQRSGIKVGVVTGRDSAVVRLRCEELGFDVHLHGIKNKVAAIDEWLTQVGISWNELAYIGDDLIDMGVIKKSLLGVTPADAPEYVKEMADVILKSGGGKGAFREFAELVLNEQGKLEGVINEFLKNAD
ncbi:MAG: HAD-IIIA family hydrolase [Cyclobacteriaceae bacterium]|nr:HAD-IIIA family hydrolase [Cyclobacteriaceae bacterium]